MTNKLPINSGIGSVDKNTTLSGGLIGRGLSAIQSVVNGVAQNELDVLYRQTRDAYNRITGYGKDNRFNIEPMLMPEAQIEFYSVPRKKVF